MRRFILRLCDAVRYEQAELGEWLGQIDLGCGREQKELSRLLRTCAKRLSDESGVPLRTIFIEESVKCASYGVLSKEDSQPFEELLFHLGRCSMNEQMRLIERADELLRSREEILRRESARRSRMIASLGVCCGVGAFLLII